MTIGYEIVEIEYVGDIGWMKCLPRSHFFFFKVQVLGYVYILVAKSHYQF